MIKASTTSIIRGIKSYVPFQVKYLFLKLFCNNFFGFLIKVSRIKFTLAGGTFVYNEVDGTTAAKIFFGIWESAEISLAKRFASNDVVVELGSSIGVTLGILQKLLPNSRFISVEASPRNFQILIKQISSIAPGHSNIELVNKAISYSGDTSVDFDVSSYSGSKIAVQGTLHGYVEKIPTMTLREITDEFADNVQYTLITDIEGAEADIFFQDEVALAKCNKIICELDDTPKYSIDDQVRRLEELGFSIIEYYGNCYYFNRI